MKTPILRLPTGLHEDLLAKLLPPGALYEEAAFLFADRCDEGRAPLTLHVTDWYPVPANAFAFRSPYYLELRETTRASLIKKAHDLGACLVEVHSHPGSEPRFSWSDCAGLEEFAPHVRWRLQSRPYAAIVVAADGFDSLVWCSPGKTPDDSLAIDADGRHMEPTGYTLANWEAIRAEQPVHSKH